jgi:hypothetical protein
MIKTVLLVLILGIASMVSASSASVEDIYAFPGQHIELKATTSGSGSYIYEWSVPLGATQLLEGSGAAAKNGPILRFDAPSTLGTYTINVQVSESSATGCVDMDSFTIKVIKCCPAFGPFCKSETVNSLCWYEDWNTCYPGTTVPYLVHASTLHYNWWVNTAITNSASFTGACFAPGSFAATPWLSPSGTGSSLNTVILKVTQTPQSYTGSPHTGDLELWTCTHTFNIYAAPDTEISVN